MLEPLDVESDKHDRVVKNCFAVDDCVGQTASDFQHCHDARTVVIDAEERQRVRVVMSADYEYFVLHRPSIATGEGDDDILPFQLGRRIWREGHFRDEILNFHSGIGHVVQDLFELGDDSGSSTQPVLFRQDRVSRLGEVIDQ